MSAEVETPAANASARGQSAARVQWTSRAALLVVWVLSAVYVAPFVDRGWIPHDEGTLAQSADRVQQGEVPHRDFDEGYTGGLSYLHALAFRAFGTSLHALRLLLFGAFLLFVPAVYAIARRALSPLLAAAVTMTCVLWTVPNYFASMGSWYNLFLATFGALAVLRHIETGRLRWLFLAGLFAGLSILVKIAGLYDVAAILLFIAWRERTLSAAAEGKRSPASTRRRSPAFAGLVTVVGFAFVAVLAVAFRARQEPMDLLHFVVPGAALAIVLVREEWREGRGAFLDRMKGVLRLAAPFLAGVAIPLAAFAFVYVRAGALGALVDGSLVKPQRLVETALLKFPDLDTLLAAVPYAALLFFPGWLAARSRRIAIPVFAVVLAGLLWAGSTQTGYGWIWSSMRSLDVVVVLVGCYRLSAGRTAPDDRRRQQIFLLLALAGCLGLIQFPFSAPIYYCYVVPFTVLALAFLAVSETENVGWAHFGVLVFAAAFALLFLNPGYVYFLGGSPRRYEAGGRLEIPRGGLRVDSKEAKEYTELVKAVAEISRGAEIYAGPEAPEVYFLCGKKNLTRIFFEGVSGVTPKTDTATLARLFERDDVKVIVWNHRPSFTHGLWRVYRERLWQRFPHSREMGKFVVMWRD